MPFEPVSDQAYMIEAGDLYFRFYRNQGQITALTTTTVLGLDGSLDGRHGNWVSLALVRALYYRRRQRFCLGGERGPIAALPIEARSMSFKFTLTGFARQPCNGAGRDFSTLSDIACLRNMGMGWHTVGFNPSGAAQRLSAVHQRERGYIVVHGFQYQVSEQ
jgi:hypothetical protein